MDSDREEQDRAAASDDGSDDGVAYGEAGLLWAVVSWIGSGLMSLEGMFATFGMYSKLELAKQQAVAELEEEYGRPIDEIIEYVDDDDVGGGGAGGPQTRQDEVADEEAMLGEGGPPRRGPDESFDEYNDPNAGDDQYSYEGMQWSDEDDAGGPPASSGTPQRRGAAA